MKYATYEHGGRERVGLVDTAVGRIYPLDVDGMIAILARPRVPMPDLQGGGLDLGEVRLLAPIPRPHRNVFETISSGITLYAGDVIATGTPKGVGVGFDPDSPSTLAGPAIRGP